MQNNTVGCKPLPTGMVWAVKDAAETFCFE